MKSVPCPQPRRWRTALSALLDSELASSEAEAARTHLAQCRDCTDWYEDARSMDHDLRVANLGGPGGSRHLLNMVEAHICGCHDGGECHCTDCRCDDCTCGRQAVSPLQR